MTLAHTEQDGTRLVHKLEVAQMLLKVVPPHGGAATPPPFPLQSCPPHQSNSSSGYPLHS